MIALAVIGNARSHRESRINPLVTAVTIALIVRWAGYFAANQVQVTPRLWPIVYAIPLGFAAISIWFIATNRGDGTAGGAGRPADLGPAPARRPHDVHAVLAPRRRVGRASLMGWTLNRYFFFRYAAITTWYFLGIYALITLIDFTEFSSRTVGYARLHRSSSRSPSRRCACRSLMLQAVPFVGLIAAIATLVSLNRKYELVIARSAGISAWQFLFPCCLGALIFGLLTVGVLNPLAAHAISRSEMLESQFRSGKSNAVNAFAAPWIRQKTDDSDTIIGARAVLNKGLELADVTFFSLDKEGDITERRDAARAYLRDGYWELHDVRRIRGGEQLPLIETDRIATNLKPEFVQERLARPETIPFYELPREDRGGALLRAQGQHFRHPVPFADGAALPARRHDADRGDGFDAICTDGAVRDDDSGWRAGGLSALCRFGTG